jgi:hypothetical protein
MKTASLFPTSINLPAALLGLAAALLVFAVLTDRKLPLLNSDRAALLVLVLIGMAMCTLSGINRVAAAGAWAHPLSILGYLLGAAILVIGLAALFGKVVPPLSSYHQAFLVVALLAAAKVVFSLVHRFLM